MMGGLTIQGLRTGPMLFQSNMDTVYGIFIALFIANVAMLVFQTFGIRIFVKILKVPRYMLIPFVMVLCTLGSYGLSKNLFDVGVMLFFGVIGYFSTKLGYGTAPMVLGLSLVEWLRNSFVQRQRCMIVRWLCLLVLLRVFCWQQLLFWYFFHILKRQLKYKKIKIYWEWSQNHRNR